MKIRFLIILSSLFICHGAHAQNMTVGASALKGLDTQTQLVKRISSFRGKEMMAEVAVLPGQSYIFKSPINVQQIQYLKGNGVAIAKNKAFAVIKGPEVHHFYMAYQMKKVLFAQASKHFANSKKLYINKALSEQAWLKISNDYHLTKMEFDELSHFFELVLSFDEEQDEITLGAPIAGVLQYNFSDALDIDSIIASFVPLQAIRLKVNLPINNPLRASSFSHQNCQIAIDFTESANSAFHQTAWSKELPEQCDVFIGQVLSISPVYELSTYKVQQSSVFNWEGSNYIFIANQNKYEAVKVTLITSENAHYIMQSEVSLDNKIVLTSSVSAVQGILQGLGL